ncbi:hypothetical protein ACGFYA_31600 [Streptomyces sp. NPDC048305]|uniref:hypothetical protein n=1 Tax=Streptomyces sp. NPDC048305 TaxID=3365532 RepID=UPI003714D73D
MASSPPRAHPGVPATSLWPAFVLGLNVWYIQRQLNLVDEAFPGAAPGTPVMLPA